MRPASEHEPFLKAIADGERRNDPGPQLRYADFLMEDGNPLHEVVRKDAEWRYGDGNNPAVVSHDDATPGYRNVVGCEFVIVAHLRDRGRFHVMYGVDLHPELPHHHEVRTFRALLIPQEWDDLKPQIDDYFASNES